MKRFYSNLKKGKAKDVALRLAKLKYLTEADPLTSHPHYWMGYVTIGNTQPLFFSYDFYFFIGLILFLAIILADQIIRQRKKRKI